jgi:type I restriction enzyme S subunit
LTLTIDKVPVEPGREYELAGVYSFGRGLFRREPLRAEKTSYKHLHALRPGCFVMSKLKAWEGAVAVVQSEYEGSVLSPEFPTYDIDEEVLLPDYLHLLTTHEQFWDLLATQSTGMGGRKERVHQTRVLDVELHLPPVSAQRRIADVINAIEDATTTAATSAHALRSLRDRLISDWVHGWNGPMALLGDIASMGSGPSWKAADETTEPGLGRVRVLGITNTPASGAVDITDTKYVSGLSDRTKTLSPGSLLMIRTNGNRSRIGNVYLVPPEAVGYAFSAFQIGLHLDDSSRAEFAFWMLSESSVQRRISEAASGSTGLGNIAVGWLKQLEIPWPDRQEDRERAAALFESADAALRHAQHLESVYRECRAALLADLLSGDHEIPISYDELSERVS